MQEQQKKEHSLVPLQKQNTTPGPSKVFRPTKVPSSLQEDPLLATLVSKLPSHYKFQIHKTIWRVLCHKKHFIKQEGDANSYTVALQFPEGLLQYSCMISDILSHFCGCECVILGDVTYGACCVDDLSAAAMGAHFLVHYGHSCLVPITKMTIPSMYIFVEIGIDLIHLVDTIMLSFTEQQTIFLLGTIQFNQSLVACKNILIKEVVIFFENQKGWDKSKLVIPQAKPRSGGQILGCTSPSLPQIQKAVIIFVSDGRFHIESTMLQNPYYREAFYLYNPYSKTISKEEYDHKAMQLIRRSEIQKAKKASVVGIIIGTLGRQGDLQLYSRLKGLLKKSKKRHITMLLSEIFPSKLSKFSRVQAWIQIACPRLSIDWGHSFTSPLLNPYEAFCAFDGSTSFLAGDEKKYPMDFYSKTTSPWSVYQDTKKVKVEYTS